MTNSAKEGAAFITASTLAGAGVSNLVGGVGLGVAGTAVGLGTVPFMGAGAVVGAAGYGAYRGIVDGDPLAIGAVSIGALGGAGFYSTVGGVGLVGGFGGVGLGIGALSTVGGVVGLGIYGAIKMLDQASFRESATQAFSRMEEKINADLAWQLAYTDALIELTFAEDNLLHRFRGLDVEDELQRLKAEVKRQNRSKPCVSMLPSGQLSINSPSQTFQSVSAVKGVWVAVDTLNHHSATVNAIIFSPDGQTVITGSDDQTVSWWNVNTGRLLYTFLQSKPVLTLAISPTNQILVAGGLDQTLTSWKLDTKLLLHIFSGAGLKSSHSGAVCSIAFSPDGKLVASGSADKLVRVWHSAIGVLKRTFNGHTDTVFSVAISPDRKLLASGGADRTIRIWTLEGQVAPQILTAHSGWVNSVIISPDGRTLISGSSDSTIKLWSLYTGEVHCTLKGHLSAVTSLAMSSNGGMLASSSDDGTIKLWKLFSDVDGQPQGEPLYTLPAKGVAAFSPDGKVIVTSGEKGVLTIWKLQE